MEKLKLPIDRLRVETFEPAAGTEAAGTVNAMADAGASGAACNPDFTTVQTKPCCP